MPKKRAQSLHAVDSIISAIAALSDADRKHLWKQLQKHRKGCRWVYELQCAKYEDVQPVGPQSLPTEDAPAVEFEDLVSHCVRMGAELGAAQEKVGRDRPAENADRDAEMYTLRITDKRKWSWGTLGRKFGLEADAARKACKR